MNKRKEKNSQQGSKMRFEEEQRLMKTDVGPTGSGGNGHGDGDVTFVLTLSVFVAVCGSFSYGCAMAYSSPVQSAILNELGLSTADYSLFGSMLNIGGLVGSLLCGKVTDYIGRRGTMGLSDVLFLSGWLAIAFSQGAWSLDLGRMTLGLANSLALYVVPVYIAEITPKNLRGRLVLLHQLMICCGVTLVYILGIVASWRILALIGILPCLVQLVGLFFIPESPRWLVNIGCDKGYEVALQHLRGENVDISLEAADIREYTKTVEQTSRANLCDVFQMRYAYALTITLGLMALASLSGSFGILFYASSIFESAGFSGTVGTITIALIQLPPTVLGMLLTDYFGRRPILLYSAAGMCIGCVSLASSFYLKEHGWLMNFSPYLALIGLLICCATFPVGLGGIPFVIMSEGAAGSLASIVAGVSGWIISYTFNFSMNWSSSGTFFIFTSVNIFTLLFVAIMVPETKGRTLEELQDLLTPILY